MTLDLRMDWSELDLFGHINNVSFFKYIQASRLHYFDEIELTRQFELTRIGPLLAATSCQFRKPLHYPGTIRVEARVEFIKTTSFGIEHRILNERGELAAEAHDVIVIYDYNKGEKAPISAELRNRIEVFGVHAGK